MKAGSSVPDWQRLRLYAACRGLPQGRSLADWPVLQQYVKRISKTRFWLRKLKGPKVVTVQDGRGCRYALADSDYNVIRIPISLRYETAVLHELAHLVCPIEPAHGRAFARTFLMLVEQYMGSTVGRALRQGYALYQVSYRQPPTDPA